jgi:tRNA A37 threonylcarbamoyladenosine synthetase subunit TsaC/SUA5/YrdC
VSSEPFATESAEDRENAIEAASLAIQRGDLVVLPTDTVYGVAADAFDPAAVRSLLAAKGRGREMPPPVLVSAWSATNRAPCSGTWATPGAPSPSECPTTTSLSRSSNAPGPWR